MSAGIPVLMYHAVSADPDGGTRRLSVHPEDFAAQLAALEAWGFTSLTLSALGDQLARGTSPPGRPVVLTFDDGYADLHREALPLLAGHGFTASVFVTTGWVDGSGLSSAGPPPDRMLTWSQVGELAEAGLEVGAHSHSHPELDQLPEATLHDELTGSRRLLEDRLGRPVTSFAYPFGYSDVRVRRAVRRIGYRYACVVGNALAGTGSDPFEFPRLTVRRSTSMTTFERIVRGDRIGALYAGDRLLTRGWAVVRRARRMTQEALRRD